MENPQLGGGPAFPTLGDAYGMQGAPGMSLRDYFAAAAFTGLLANHDNANFPTAKVAAWAVGAADELLSGLSKKVAS